MSDAAAPADTINVSAAPAVEGAAPAPVVAEGGAPAATEGAPAPETPKPEGTDAPKTEEGDGVKPHTDEPTLLEGGEKPKEEAKPGEEKKEGEAGEAPKPIELQPYTLPEGVKLDDKGIQEFNTVLTDDKITPQERGQKLMDMYTKSMTDYDRKIRQEQHTAFAETRAGWRKAVMADEQIGGAGHQTAMTAVARMRDMFVPEQRRGEFNDFLRVTGAGDSPAFLRFLHDVARRFDEPPPQQPPYKPPPDIGKKPGARGKRGTLYDHPSSSQNRG